MLSKIFNSARNILSHTPEPESIKEAQETTNQSDPNAMVTTRRQELATKAGGEGSLLDVPGSQTSPLVVDAVDSNKRKETLPVRAKDELQSPRNSRIEIVIPVSQIPKSASKIVIPESGAEEIPEIQKSQNPEPAKKDDEESLDMFAPESDDKIAEESTPEDPEIYLDAKTTIQDVLESNPEEAQSTQQAPVLAEKAKLKETIEIVDDSESPDTSAIVEDVAREEGEQKSATPGSRSQNNIAASSPATLAPTPKIPTKRKSTPVQSMPSSSQLNTKKALAILSTPPPQATKHKRFGSEEPEVEIPPVATEAPVVEIEDSEDDSDDAPEEFTKEIAAETHETRARDTAKAIEE